MNEEFNHNTHTSLEQNTQQASGQNTQQASGQNAQQASGQKPQQVSEQNGQQASAQKPQQISEQSRQQASAQFVRQSVQNANTQQSAQNAQQGGHDRPYTQNTYSWMRQDQEQNTQQNWNSQPHYNYYQRQQAAGVRQTKEKKKGHWAALIAMALVFGLIAGAVTYGVNLIGNRIYPAVSQSGASVQEEPQNESGEEPAVSLAKTESAEDGGASAGTSTGQVQTVAKVAEEAMPALVTIATVSVQEMQSFFGIQQYEAQGAGTGVIVGENDTELLIATNQHVISGANEISIGFIDEQVVPAQIKGEDESTDLAIVSVKKEDIPEETLDQIKIAVTGDSDSLVLGEQVVAIGNALGIGQSVTSGYVSALHRELDLSDGMSRFVSTDLIQTDAAINSGNSGGALLNMNGELIGINEAKSAYTSSGVTVDNVGYAIPMAKAQPILEELMNQATRESYSEDEQGYLGVSLADVSRDMAQMYNMPEGVCFTEVAEGSPAAEAGIYKGDVLTEVDGRTITSSTALMKEMTYHKSGETIEMKVLRSIDGEYQEFTLSVTLGTKDVLEALSAE